MVYRRHPSPCNPHSPYAEILFHLLTNILSLSLSLHSSFPISSFNFSSAYFPAIVYHSFSLHFSSDSFYPLSSFIILSLSLSLPCHARLSRNNSQRATVPPTLSASISHVAVKKWPFLVQTKGVNILLYFHGNECNIPIPNLISLSLSRWILNFRNFSIISFTCTLVKLCTFSGNFTRILILLIFTHFN